ncbi:MAG: hydroxyacid dehydrogenase [Candidatus Doudnabacteria bacterium CG10_big_fil_rev_8_21_14_0_10_41_10]|uniref:Hydroxyacid dehydrogenase n=1 Tax=Candidatus Doudnabacteria bacterium CG10_big_fil_rev_8_21_14_0_10_41_10 TaxID=1974551 RepID=A0A2H0VD20_9BACT|nr:MAG: hydroxyacid dehydrogenase [Candidatus Doudnabacteria bacterium CG10_big_fil_rev_8_21_14_0_10_41_10]
MKKTRIVFFETDEKWREDGFRKELPSSKFDLIFTNSKLNSGTAKRFKNVEIAVVFIRSKIDAKVFSLLPRLKLVATNSTGFDHIDLGEAKKSGVKVCTVPFYGENTVAEHTFAMILAISRKIVRSVNRTRRGKFVLDGLRGFDLKGKTIGVVGTGHIGQHVIRIAHGFEMKILAYSIKKDRTLESKYPLQYVNLEKLLKNSDIVTLHAPYKKETHHMINRQNIKKFKPGSLLINTARGGLVETSALLWALQKRILAGAGLDVLEEEGIITEDKAMISGYHERKDLAVVLADHKLMSLDNVIVTPHNAFNSDESVRRIIETTITNIKAWKKGSPVNLVN